jgi:hypothetical protein
MAIAKNIKKEYVKKKMTWAKVQSTEALAHAYIYVVR